MDRRAERLKIAYGSVLRDLLSVSIGDTQLHNVIGIELFSEFDEFASLDAFYFVRNVRVYGNAGKMKSKILNHMQIAHDMQGYDSDPYSDIYAYIYFALRVYHGEFSVIVSQLDDLHLQLPFRRCLLNLCRNYMLIDCEFGGKIE